MKFHSIRGFCPEAASTPPASTKCIAGSHGVTSGMLLQVARLQPQPAKLKLKHREVAESAWQPCGRRRVSCWQRSTSAVPVTMSMVTPRATVGTGAYVSLNESYSPSTRCAALLQRQRRVQTKPRLHGSRACRSHLIDDLGRSPTRRRPSPRPIPRVMITRVTRRCPCAGSSPPPSVCDKDGRGAPSSSRALSDATELPAQHQYLHT